MTLTDNKNHILKGIYQQPEILLLLNQVLFYDDPVRFTDSVNKLCDELEDRVKKGIGIFPKGTTRVIVSGCPMAVPNWKLPMLIESVNAVIVGEESCVGERGYPPSRRELAGAH